jgi:hypothetical protein
MSPSAECGHCHVRRPRRPQEESRRDRPEVRECFDEHVVQRGYALTLPQCCDEDAKSAFANCEHAAALALGSKVPNSGHCCRSPNETLWNASLGLLRLDPGELHDLAPLFRFIRDHFSEISRRHRCRHDAKLAETRFHLGIG